MPINHTQRYIAGERVGDVSLQLSILSGNLTRLRGPHKSGLTPKEDAYIERMSREVQELMTQAHKMSHRLRTTAQVDWRGINEPVRSSR